METDKERRKLCRALGLYLSGLSEHGDSLILLDRLIQARRLIAADSGLYEALEWVDAWLTEGEFKADHKEEGQTIRRKIKIALRKARAIRGES